MAINIPKSLKIDTSHTLQCQTVPKSTSQQGIDHDANCQQRQLQNCDEQGTIVYNLDTYAMKRGSQLRERKLLDIDLYKIENEKVIINLKTERKDKLVQTLPALMS